MQVIQVIEGLLDGLRDRDALGIRKRAEVAARAADDVCEQADVGRGQTLRPGLLPQRVELAEFDVGEDQVLLVRDTDLAEAVTLGEVGHRVHLYVGGVAGAMPVGLSESVTAR